MVLHVACLGIYNNVKLTKNYNAVMFLYGGNWQTIAVKFLLSKQKNHKQLWLSVCSQSWQCLYRFFFLSFNSKTYTIAMLNRKLESKPFRFDVCHALPSSVLCVKPGDGKTADFTELCLCLCCRCCRAERGKNDWPCVCSDRQRAVSSACAHTHTHTQTMHMHAHTMATVTLVDPAPYTRLPRLLLTHVHWLVAN